MVDKWPVICISVQSFLITHSEAQFAKCSDEFGNNLLNHVWLWWRFTGENTDIGIYIYLSLLVMDVFFFPTALINQTQPRPEPRSPVYVLRQYVAFFAPFMWMPKKQRRVHAQWNTQAVPLPLQFILKWKIFRTNLHAFFSICAWKNHRTWGCSIWLVNPFYPKPDISLRAVWESWGPHAVVLVSVKRIYLRINFHGVNEMRAPRRM